MNESSVAVKLIARLINSMERNERLYQQLAEELVKETEALKTHSLIFVEEVVLKKNEIASQLKSVESERITILGRLAKELNQPIEEITLRTLAGKFPTHKEKLLDIRNRMNSNVAIVGEKNEFNQKLIERLIDINHNAAAHLSKLNAPDVSYDKGAKEESKKPFRPGRIVSQRM